MKKVLLPSLAALLLLFSCVRSEDWEMLRSPMHIQGEIDPQFGFPVASSQMLLGDVIGLFPQASQYIDSTSNSDFIQLSFDTTLTTNMRFDGSKKSHSRRAKGMTQVGDTLIFDTIYRGEQNINFFGENDIITKVKISNMIVDWVSELSLQVSDEFQNIDTNQIKAYLLNFTIDAVGLDNTHVNIPLSNVGVINIGRLIGNQTQTVHILDNMDITELASQLTEIAPKKISYSTQFQLKAANTYFATPEALLYDSLKIEAINIVSDIHVSLPINVSIESITHTIDTVPFAMGANLDSIITSFETSGISLEMKNAQIKLKVDNTLPFDVKIGAIVLDENQQSLFTILDTNNTALTGAPIAPSAENPSLYVTTGSARSEISVDINYDKLQQLQNAKYVRFIIAAATSRDNNGNYPFVAPRKTDGIDIKMYIKLHPGIQIDIPLGNPLGDALGKKGGNE